ncbi:hypothetical protein KAJ27_14720 [bacterium]|nr:hypothetical protein [bacterium]
MNEGIIKILLKTYEDLLEHYQEIRKISEKYNFDHKNPVKIKRYLKKKQKLIDRIIAKNNLVDTLWTKVGIVDQSTEYDKALKLEDDSAKECLLNIFSQISSEIVIISELEEKKLEIINEAKDSIASEIGIIRNKNLIHRYNMPKKIIPGSFINKIKGTD